ncbi:MAG: hypothetical protein ABW032_11985, partial [Burkholderiaceae bacterium]
MQTQCIDVMHSQSIFDLSKKVTSFIQDIGFNYYGVVVVTDHSKTLTEFQSIENAPESYRDGIHDPELGKLD